MSRRLLIPALVAVLLPVTVSQAAPSHRLGPVVRVQTPGTAVCHAESETAVSVTAAGTWVAYNDIGACQAADAALGEHITYLQLLPTAGGPARVIALPPLEGRWGYLGDPALSPDADGRGVVLSSMAGLNEPQLGKSSVSTGALRVEVLRVSGEGVARRLPAASGPKSFDDKEAVAVDRGSRSHRRGWVYLAWDEGSTRQVTLRAFDGRRWSPGVAVYAGTGGRPDVAVGPSGSVAVAYETAEGVEVRVAADPRRPLGRAVLALKGGDPGHIDPSCPLINAVGIRQRVIRSPRLAWDSKGRLHLVAALGTPLNVAPTAAGGVESSVVLASSSDAGLTWTRQRLTEGTSWAPAITALPGGEVAVGYLELADGTGRTFTAHVWRSSGGSRVVSEGPAPLAAGTETTRSNYCYGMGDYSGIASQGADVVYVWPSTAGATGPGYDTDILVRRSFG